MRTAPSSQYGREDRDLLVELRTEMIAVRGDIKELKDNTASRLTSVENGKLDRSEFNRLQADQMTADQDKETRIRRLEWALGLSTGGLLVLQFGLQYIGV